MGHSPLFAAAVSSVLEIVTCHSRVFLSVFVEVMAVVSWFFLNFISRTAPVSPVLKLFLSLGWSPGWLLCAAVIQVEVQSSVSL